jgi:hypothetical protein
MRMEKTCISKIRKEKWEATTNTKEIQGIITYYIENIHSNKFENLGKMDKFLHTSEHSKLHQEDINHLMKLK